MKHILILGDRGAGKSTLIRRLLKLTSLPLFGFFTKKEDTFPYSVYLWPAYAPENKVVAVTFRCTSHNVNLKAFNELGAQSISRAEGNRGLIVMDELGFLESKASVFTESVLKALDGDIPILAAVKNRSEVPFLEAVLKHPKAQVFIITSENREDLYKELAPVVSGLSL